MAIKQIAMDTAILQSDIDTMETTLGQAKKTAGQLFDNLKALDSMWEGQAHSAFMAQFASDYELLTQLYGVLGNLVDDIKTARKEYDQCESSIGTIIKDIQV